MARLFGQEMSRADLLERTGDISQVAGVRRLRLEEGKEEGVGLVEVRTGTGLRYTVLPSRGLDVSFAEYKGIPLCWRSSTGDVSPHLYEPAGNGWHRSFYGGLVTTCGLTNVGAPSVDQGEELGRHGRISSTPAEAVYADGRWEEDEYRLIVQGRMRQAIFWGENLAMSRRIESRLGASWLKIQDEVENRGFKPTPLMLLYHVNIGFPLLSRDSTILIPAGNTTAMDPAVDAGSYSEFHDPGPEAPSQVYYHDAVADSQGMVNAALINERLLLGLYLRYRKDQLKNLVQWKLLGQGGYVLGIEPANCHVEGRAAERARGTLEFLAPGETRRFQLELGVLDSKAEIGEWKTRIKRLT